ncbi:MAG: hypothetical protein PHQ58_02170 [Rhodoferax sp.]|uniref:hypothetical protein n=1 Tax=Rhodoferax sp. TaxID=50421 RepID=UPI00262B4A51|nr:hypothetical protein [Rhodoferax sp.]MDD2879218.1 hypothetical protein [Rhodoferax sp.]
MNISPVLDGLISRLDKIRKLDFRHVFPTRDNNQYSDGGFKTLWQRFVLEAIKQGVLTKGTRFTFHDLRAFYATKHKKVTGALPDLHKNPETTARVYDRSTEVFRSSN